MEFATIRETAKKLGLAEYHVRILAKTRQIPGFYSGSRFYCNVEGTQEKLAELSAKHGNIQQCNQ